MKHTVTTLEVYLPSVGLNERRSTKHKYAHSEMVTKKGVDGKPITGVAHFYRCTETDTLKQYGFDQGTLGAGIN